MANLKLKNFNKNNTPEWAAKVGNALLMAGGVGVAILTLPAAVAVMVPGLVIALPTVVTSIGTGLTVAGVFGKIFSKMFGEEESK